MKNLILTAALFIFAISSNGAVTTIDNPFDSNVEIDHPLFAEGAGSSKCKGLRPT